MSPSNRERHIEAILTRQRQLLEQRWPQGPVTIDQIEQLVEDLQRDLARELEQRILDDQPHPEPNQVACPTCVTPARYRGTYRRLVLTLHGERTLCRRYYYCRTCRAGFAPLDLALGLSPEITTPQLRLRMARLGAREEFATATATLEELTGVRVSSTTIERATVALGTAWRAAQEQQAQQHLRGRLPVPDSKPQRLYISMDGKMIPLRDPWKKDGTGGPLVCRYGECKLGVVYEAVSGPQEDAGVQAKAYVATLEEVGAFTPLIATLAHQHGQHLAREVVVLGDGALWIWNLAASQFPQALQIVDFYHASEHLYQVAHARFGEGTAEAKGWVVARQKELQADQLARVLTAIAQWQPQSAELRQLQASEYHYFANNAERMRYGTFTRKGYHIGSGVVESGCGHVLGRRLDQAGMHWRRETAEAIAGLRAALCSTHPPDLRPYCSRVA